MLWDNMPGTKKVLKMERAVHYNGSAPAGSRLSLGPRACGALRKSETSGPGRLVRTKEHGRTRVFTGGASMRCK